MSEKIKNTAEYLVYRHLEAMPKVLESLDNSDFSSDSLSKIQEYVDKLLKSFKNSIV